MNAIEVLNETYQIVSEIGSGAGGVVYHAYHKRLQTDVVIKRIKDEVVGKIQGRSEADVLKNIKHPYLPRVYDFIETDDGIFTVMDYIKGQNLEDALKEHGPYSQNEVLKWAIQISEALEYLHNQVPPVIHSDIKPANIMLTPSGDICLIDFNISLAIGNEEKNSVGVSGGFSPPEQYWDVAMYNRISQRYNASKMTGNAKSAFRASKNLTADDDVTEIIATNNTDANGTVILQSSAVNNVRKNKTQLLMMSSGGTSNKTESYYQYIGQGICKSSDIYSTGMCLLSFLTGLLPNGRFEENLNASNCKVRLSQGFETILNKMIALNPKDRYADGAELATALKNIHKYDKRYVKYKRNALIMNIASIAMIVAGGMLLAIGGVRYKYEKSTKYYSLISELQDNMESGDYDDALDIIGELRENDKDISSYCEEVKLYYLMGDYETCSKLGEDYIYEQPFYVETEDDRAQMGTMYYYTGNAFYKLSDYYSAENYFEKALEYDGNADYYRDYAVALAKNGKSKEAKKALKNAEKEGLDKASAKYANAEIDSINGDYDSAIELFEEVIDKADDSELVKRAVLSCCDIYLLEGEDSLYKAVSLIENSKKNIYEDTAVSRKLITVYLTIAQSGGADSTEYYEKAIEALKKNSKNGLMLYDDCISLGVAYMQIQDYENATETLNHAIEINPKRYESYMYLSYVEGLKQQDVDVNSRSYSAMIEYYNKALDLYDADYQNYQMTALEQFVLEAEEYEKTN